MSCDRQCVTQERNRTFFFRGRKCGSYSAGLHRTKKFNRRAPNELNLPTTTMHGSSPKRLKLYVHRVKTVQLSEPCNVPKRTSVASYILIPADDDESP